MTIRQILKSLPVNSRITVKGWARAIRRHKDVTFVDVSDGSSASVLQVTAPSSAVPKSITLGAGVEATGDFAEHKNGVELRTESVSVVSPCSTSYPFAERSAQPLDYVRQYLHLRPKTTFFGSLLRVRNTVTKEIHNYFTERNYIHIDVPVLTSNDCEGAGETFRVSAPKEGFFDSTTFLSVSGQLHLEAAANGLAKVYTLGPVFRAENSKSRLHLSEFYMLEVERAFTEDMSIILSDIEDCLKTVTTKVLASCPEELNFFSQKTEMAILEQLDKLCHSEFPVMTHAEAASVLGGVRPSKGLTKEQELSLVKHVGGVPVFIVNWPTDAKPFYVRSKDGFALAFDLLVPNVGELCGGSLRECDCNELQSRLAKLYATDELNWYVDLRKYGAVPTGGYGIGFERYIQYLLGIDNIKDTIPFPRWPHNCRL